MILLSNQETRNIALTNARCKQTKTKNGQQALKILTHSEEDQKKIFLVLSVYTPCGGRFYSGVLGEKAASFFRIEVGAKQLPAETAKNLRQTD